MKNISRYSPKLFGVPKRELTWYAPGACSLHSCLTELKEVKGKVLDIGCAAGQTTLTLKRHRPDLEFFGIDPMEEAIEIAQKTCPGIKFEAALAEKLPFDDNFFDAVISIAAWEHVDNPRKVTAETLRVLKPGGIFFAITPQEKSKTTLHGILGPKIWRLNQKYCGHKRQFQAGDLISLFQNAGFKIEKVYFSNFLVYQLIDVFYLYFLSVFKFPPSFSFGGYIAAGKPNFKKRVISILRNLSSGLINIENFLLGRIGIPGFLVHIRVVKPK
jgi:2-polyprenyl-3-methyl-5-hydroxy-6-metoxy-1,4-benzoquinol methylase